MNSAVFTNAALLQFYNLKRGTNKTVLNLSDVVSMGVTVKCVDIYPVAGSPAGQLHLTDAFTDVQANGINYVSFPDFVNNNFPTFNEQKDIQNESISFKISNINPSFRVLANSGAFRKARVNIYLTILSPADNTVIEHDLMFSGYIDFFETEANNQSGSVNNDITVNLNSIWNKLDVQMRTLAANSVHQSTNPGDEYFSLLGIIHAEQQWKYK
ncbi:DUF2163 domain-containing protein [Pantoea agglomerans]|uniref:DUF2163 domain-containing protein n=1 Tax=Enterobacter agglomerans TaxID=549 RepID=UPI000E20D5EB|nr:DUF2163 domain-containing protein [Pantoea agglomerans]WNK29216.1 DUF2163 domain-containing protein [Pantoea agglomerans]